MTEMSEFGKSAVSNLNSSLTGSDLEIAEEIIRTYDVLKYDDVALRFNKAIGKVRKNHGGNVAVPAFFAARDAIRAAGHLVCP